MTESSGTEDQQSRSPAETPDVIQKAIDKREVSWELLMGISLLTTPTNPADTASPEVGYRHINEAIEIYKERWGGDVGLFPPIGAVCIHGDGHFEWSFNLDRIRFDWSEVWPLTYQIESLAEEAREWWPDPDSSDEESLGRLSMTKRVMRFLKQGFVRVDRPEVARHPHTSRAFGLAAWIMGAMVLENKRHSATQAGTPPAPTDALRKDLSLYRQELISAQKRFRAAAQRTAQSRYWQGAIVGTAVVAMICLLIGLVFWWRGTDAAYAVAIPAGSLGAVVSVLQRMNSGKLVLDIDASRDMLEVFGAVRPLIGAVFGLAVTALLIGGLIPAIRSPAARTLPSLPASDSWPASTSAGLKTS